MRRKRTYLALLTLTFLLAVPEAAAANGGAYLELDRQHYLPGETGTATTYVTVPERRERIFDRGPFHLFLLPDGATLREGRPIPASAVRIGTFSIEDEGKQYELTAPFTVPQVTGAFYSLGLCNDPCTVTGFREYLSASISVVTTPREASLINENNRVWNRLYVQRFRRERAARRADRFEAALDRQIAVGADERDRLTGRIEELETELAAAQRGVDARPLFDPWLVGGVVTLALAAAGLTFRRRRLVTALAPIQPASGNGSAKDGRTLVRSGSTHETPG